MKTINMYQLINTKNIANFSIVFNVRKLYNCANKINISKTESEKGDS